MSTIFFEKLIPCDIAHTILQDYLIYHHQYKRINKRAKIRFENKDWEGIQLDSRERITQYKIYVQNTTDKIKDLLKNKLTDRSIWKQIRNLYFEEIINFNTRNIAETYYNSVFRHCFRGSQEIDVGLMFVTQTVNYADRISPIPIYHTIFLSSQIKHALSQILFYYDFDAPFEDMGRDIDFIFNTLHEKFDIQDSKSKSIRLELIKSLFFRNKCAYVVGRIVIDQKVYPFIIPLLHGAGGIFADALLLDIDQVAAIFSYSRSYFLVDTDIASDMVHFLKSILPHKSLDELYNSLGFINHAKTEFYRNFVEHLERTQDKFIIAPGVKGMVMTVFSLPSYNMVFKVIKDRFDPPKNTTAKMVKEKYNLVSLHDRVGRMVDSHMFNNLVFDKSRFSSELLDELLQTIPSKLTMTEHTLTIKHLYVEKKMIPLDIYLDSADESQKKSIIRDYGQAIKELAYVNIFPGDLLLKNFGVNRLKKVVFYDYDEIDYITNLKFKNLPKARYYEDEMMSDSWFTPDLNDVFPENFPSFMFGNLKMREMILSSHPNLFDPNFWNDIKKKLLDSMIISVFPYDQRLRFCNKISVPQNDFVVS